MNAIDTVRSTLDLCECPTWAVESAKAYAALADLEALVQAAEALLDEWRMSAKEINAAAIDRAERAERQRDRAIEALRNGMECGETVAIRAWCACVLAAIEKDTATDDAS